MEKKEISKKINIKLLRSNEYHIEYRMPFFVCLFILLKREMHDF